MVSSQVIADNEAGLLFKNKRDRKVINVDPRLKPGDNSTRTELMTSEFLQASGCKKRKLYAGSDNTPRMSEAAN